MTMAQLVLIRHGESEWNAKGLWSGLTDISLNEKGRKEAFDSGIKLKDIPFSTAFISALVRTKETLNEILKSINTPNIPVLENKALNERDYGDYTGKNKWEVKKQVGDEQFLKIRRSWDYPIPGGESLKDVYSRVVPYYQSSILPRLVNGENVLVVSSQAPIRALVKYLEDISDTDIPKFEIATGTVLAYEVNQQGTIVSKEIRGERKNTV